MSASRDRRLENLRGGANSRSDNAGVVGHKERSKRIMLLNRRIYWAYLCHCTFQYLLHGHVVCERAEG